MSQQFLTIQIPRPLKKKTTSNYISTTKYNIITFLPFSLILQFKRYANIYFLACAILQSIPLISPLNPSSAIAPLVFVLFLSVARQGYQDYKRYQNDKQNNKSQTHIYEGSQLKKYQWKKIKPADIIKLQQNQLVPADLIILISQSKSGITYVQTSSLDGQKNLKPKLSISQFQQFYNQTQQIPNFFNLSGEIMCSLPQALNIESFQAKCNLKLKTLQIKTQINKKYILHRGSKIKNTKWVIGLAVYCGKQTSIMMNGTQAYTKTSNIQNMVNRIILLIFAFQLLCAFGSAIYCYFKCLDNIIFQQFIRNNSSVNCISTAAISLGSYFLLYNTFIPISLIVSLQFVKVFQGLFIQNDKQMYSGINQRKTQCHTVSINQQLGQIQYILTDKTGTLTCNKMEFRNIVIGTQIYGKDLILNQVQQNFDFSQLSRRFSVSSASAIQKDISNQFNSIQLSYQLSVKQQQVSTYTNLSKKNLIQQIFFMIATCHQCISSNGNYQGPSPDQVALLKASKSIGFQFISTQNKITTVKYKNKQYKFKILRQIQFDSVRKRMTIVLKTDNIIKVYVKGADSSIIKLLSKNQKYLKSIQLKSQQMAKTGLRSLWFAYKQLPLQSFSQIQKIPIEQLQNNLQLIGASGIQDRLQDFVPQTIYACRQGGIKFIMLTGDKLQTAQNIAISCRLIEKGFLINSQQRVKQFMKRLQQQRRSSLSFSIQLSPVIDGSCISFIQLQDDLLYIIPRVNSLVFCRVTPGQKAQIVKLVKKLNKLTLAIGDGANDTNMIMQAHVGVGIFGQQGTRAAQISNYAIGQFCILWKLLLHYGRLNYMRISQMILYSFYKNMVFTIVQFLYCFYNNGSGQSFWSSWPITLFNMIFTFFPVVMRAVFQVDLNIQSNKKTFKQLSQGRHSNQILYSYFPKLYIISQKNQLFTKLIFFQWFALGISQGIICLIITLYALGDTNDSSGYSSYQSGFSFCQISAYTSVIIIVTIKIAINIKQWNIILVIGFILPTFGGYIAFRIIFNIVPISDIDGYMNNLLTMPSFYLCQILCIMGMFSFDFFLFSLDATKNNFQNYLKFRTIRQKKLSVQNLNKFILEMEQKDYKKVKLITQY